jgi:hypothetical protein
VLVGRHREARVSVAEALGDDLDRCADGDKQRGVRVAQIVETDPRETKPTDLSIEELRESLRMDGIAKRVGEHRFCERRR